GVSGIPFCLFFLTAAHGKIKIGRAADTAHQRQGSAGNRQGKSHIGGGISQRADAVADKKLVDDIIKSADQHGDDAGNGESGQELVDRLCTSGLEADDVVSMTDTSFV